MASDLRAGTVAKVENPSIFVKIGKLIIRKSRK